MIRRYLTQSPVSLAVAIGTGLVLAILAPVVASLFGPAVTVLVSPAPQASYELAHLLGQGPGWLVGEIIGATTVSGAELWRWLPGLLLAAGSARALLAVLQWALWERIGERAAASMRAQLARQLVLLDPAKRHLPDVTQAEETLAGSLAADIALFREYLIRWFGGLPKEGLVTMGYLVFLAFLSPRLLLIFGVAVVPLAVVIGRYSRKLRRRAADALEEYGDLAEFLQHRVLGLETIKHLGTEAEEAARIRMFGRQLERRYLRAARAKAKTTPLMELAAILGMVVAMGFAIQATATQPGSGSVYLSFFATLAFMSQSATKLGKYVNVGRQGAAAHQRLQHLLHTLDTHQRAELTRFSTPVDPAQQVALTCRQLTVGYEGRPVVVEVDMTLRPGEIVCICGASGAGKTTLAKTLLGLLAPLSGQIEAAGALVDGSRAYIPQDPALIPGTVRDNLLFPTCADAERQKRLRGLTPEAAIALVGLEERLNALAEGLDTWVGPGLAVPFSGGEVQRLHLARIAVTGARLVVVDEGTSALDPVSEAEVMMAMRRIADLGTVVLMIAHRRAAALASDRIVWLANGRIKAEFTGTQAAASKEFQGLFQGSTGV